jgi:death on curing protein
MAGIGKTLTRSDLIELNRKLVLRSGGEYFFEVDNLLNAGSFDYLVEMIQHSDFFQDIFHMAAYLAQRIICGHLFFEGNKRTGMAAATALLQLNQLDPKIGMDVVDVAVSVALGTLSVDDLASWLRRQCSLDAW